MEASRVGAGLRFQCSLSASFATLTCERRGGHARVRRRQGYGRVKGVGSLEMAENSQPRGLKKRGHRRSIDAGAHLLVHDVVEEDVIVVWILVLLGQLGFRVHEVRGGAGVRALAVGTFAPARSLHAARRYGQIAEYVFKTCPRVLVRFDPSTRPQRSRKLDRLRRRFNECLSRAARGFVPHRRVPE